MKTLIFQFFLKKFFHQWQKAYKRVCEFVGIEPTETIVRLKKTNPFQIEDMLENFDEVKSELKNTPYEWMLYK